MTKLGLTRRQFTKGLGAGVLGLALWPTFGCGPNDRLRVAILGVRGHGKKLIDQFLQVPRVEIAAICDPDADVAAAVVDDVAKRQPWRPRDVRDLRKVFDDPEIDAVAIATPHHWHALAAIWAMQAGKDVYLEKPVSHTVREGRLISLASETYGRICQSGTHRRSHGAMAAAAEALQGGAIGHVKRAHCLSYRPRKSIGPSVEGTAPPGLDLDLWTGPAPKASITRSRFHYDWHWFWDYGNGGITNNGVHRIDLARWALKLEGLGDRTLSWGGRVGYRDAGQTPNTQVTLQTFGDVTVVQEVRGLESDAWHEAKNGVIFMGDGAQVVMTSNGAALYDESWTKVSEFPGEQESHAGNFVEAVFARDRSLLNCDITEGHFSSALCHLANISHRLGQKADLDAIAGALEGWPEAEAHLDVLSRMQIHLQANGVSPDDPAMVLGAALTLDGSSEKLVDNDAANGLLFGSYRAPFVLPLEILISDPLA
jgi:predicted dehydrogenase